MSCTQSGCIWALETLVGEARANMFGEVAIYGKIIFSVLHRTLVMSCPDWLGANGFEQVLPKCLFPTKSVFLPWLLVSGT
jgi:hypothetical protein